MDGPHASDTLRSVVAVTTRFVGAVGGMRSEVRDDWAETRDELQIAVNSTTCAVLNNGADVLVMRAPLSKRRASVRDTADRQMGARRDSTPKTFSRLVALLRVP